MDEQGLHIAITASSGSASDAVGELQKRLDKLAAAYNSNNKAATEAGKGAEKAGGLFSKLSKVFKDIEEHSRTASMALGQMGLHTDAAAAKVSGLGNLFKGLGSAAPMLLGVGAALTAVGGAAEFLKGSADKAAAFQQSMDILGRTVKDSGADWASARKQVLAFADAQERTTTYSRDDVVNALRQMTSAGMSYKDAMAEIRVAEDASTATGQSLMTVSHGLVEALHGRTQALTMLGIGTKQSIHQGMTLYQMNAAIEKQMGGSAQSAAQGYAGSMQRLHNAFETLQEKIGTAVLPILTKLAQTLTAAVETAEKDFAKWEAAAHAFYLRNKQAFDAIGTVVKGVWTGIEDVTRVVWGTISGVVKSILGGIADEFTFFADLFTGHFDRLWTDVKNSFGDAFHNLLSGFGNFGENLITIAERIAKAVAHAFEAPFSAMADALHGNFAKAKSDLAGTFSGFGNLMGGLKPWTLGGGSSHEEAASNPLLALSAAAGNTMAGGPMAGAGRHGKHAGSAYTAADRAARTAAQSIALEAAAHGKNAAAIENEIKALQHELQTRKMSASERMRIQAQIIALKHQETVLEQHAQHARDAALKKHEAAVQSAIRKEYAHVVSVLQAELKAHQITYGQMAGILQSWVDAHKNASQQIIDNANNRIATLDSQQQTADEQAQKRLEKQQAAWQKYYNALESNAQKWTSTTATWIDQMFAHGKKGVNSFAETFKKMLKDIEQALLKSALFEMFMGGQGAKGPSFMSLFAKNMGFGGNGASAPAGGGGMGTLGMLSMGASLLGGKGGGALSGIAGMFGAKTGGGSANGSGGIIGALIGTSAATQLASSLPTDSLMSLMFGVGAPSMAGGLGGSSGSGGGLAGFIPVAAGAGGPGGGTILGSAMGGSSGILGAGANSALSGIFKGGIKGIASFLGTHASLFGGTATYGSIGLGALGGYLVGTGIGDLVYGNQPLNQGAKIGGTIGGALGTFGGPVGSLIGATLGSLVGGLFGNHDNPANMPDKYDTANYLAAMSTLNGNANWHANGQTIANFSQDQQAYSMLMSASGGKSGISWIEQTLAQYAVPGTTQMGANTPAWLQPMWNQLVSAFGVSASGGGKMNWGHAINNEWITGAQGVTNSSGSPLQYTDFMDLLNQFYQGYITQGQTTVTSPNNPSNNGSGFNVSSPFAGAYVVGAPGSAPQLVSGSGLPTFSLNPDPGAPGSPVTVPVNNGVGNDMAHTKPGGAAGGITINVTVPVAGSVSSENDLVETIRQRLRDEFQNLKFSYGMALEGIGL